LTASRQKQFDPWTAKELLDIADENLGAGAKPQTTPTPIRDSEKPEKK
jgi:hypothetical protein